jgi:hypothetical protein
MDENENNRLGEQLKSMLIKLQVLIISQKAI